MTSLNIMKYSLKPNKLDLRYFKNVMWMGKNVYLKIHDWRFSLYMAAILSHKLWNSKPPQY